MEHYKDAQPSATVARARRVIADVGLSPLETWMWGPEGICSVRLVLPGISSVIGVNGKGVSAPLALASAHGELLERLQNLLLYPLFRYHVFDRELREIHGFHYFPDEEDVGADDLFGGASAGVMHALCPGEKADFFSGGECAFLRDGDTHTVLPYLEYGSGAEVMLPFTLLLYTYGSTGMCAGNSEEEALVQGVCEIMERYAIWRVLRGDLVPPTVDEAVIAAAAPGLAAVIDAVKEKHGYSMRVMDLSLGENLPVLGVALIDPASGRYFVKVGSHPDRRIALERCLTEIYQHRDPDRFPAFRRIDARERDHAAGPNLADIFRNGRGSYPISMFSSNPTYRSDPHPWETRYGGNGECLSSLLHWLVERGHEILKRDVGFLGFPAYHIVIPGLSKPDGFPRSFFTGLRFGYDMTRTALHWPVLADEEAREMERYLHGREATMADITGLPFQPGAVPGILKSSRFLAWASDRESTPRFPPLRCPDCRRCPYSGACTYPEVRMLHVRLKLAMRAEYDKMRAPGRQGKG